MTVKSTRVRKVLAQILISSVALLRGYNKEQILFLLAQANLETGNFTSKYWFSDKNMFGMSEMSNAIRRRRLVGVRLGPDGLYRAQFGNLYQSIADRLDWDKQNGITRKNYAEAVSRIYLNNGTYATAVTGRIDGTLSMYYYASFVLVPVTFLIIYKIISLW